MKKILITVNHDVVIYNFRLEIVERLLNEGHRVIVSSPYGERIDELIELGCEYIDATISRHGTNIMEDLNLFNYYLKTIRKVKPDVVLSFTIKPNIYGGIVCRLLNIPYIANITGLGTAVEKKSMVQKISILLYKVAFKKVNCIFFQNEENKRFFVNNKIAIDKHKLLPGSGVNLKRFDILEYPNKSKLHFVFISRIMQAKGIDQYLDAAEYISNKYSNVEFHVCGFCEEDYEEKLNLLEKRGIVNYHGMVREVKDVLAFTHCTIHPTYYPEGLSNVLLESAASGRPIISTDRSGCREVIDDEVNGYLVAIRNSSDLIKKIEKFIQLDYQQKKNMGLAGRKKVEKEFDREIVVENYLQEINEI